VGPLQQRFAPPGSKFYLRHSFHCFRCKEYNVQTKSFYGCQLPTVFYFSQILQTNYNSMMKAVPTPQLHYSFPSKQQVLGKQRE